MGQSVSNCQPHLTMYSFVFLAMMATAMAAPQQVPYVHQEIPAEPYIHEEVAAEPYVHIEPALTPEALGEVAPGLRRAQQFAPAAPVQQFAPAAPVQQFAQPAQQFAPQQFAAP